MPRLKTICIKCEKELENSMSEYQPLDGTAFETKGNYGSSVTDHMDGTSTLICVCDVCMKDAIDLGNAYFMRTEQMSWSRERAFKDLLNCIEKENINDLDGFAAVCFPPESAGGHCTFHLVHKAYKGDLNAARSLHESVLSNDHQWIVGSMRDGKRSVTFAGGMNISEPARAWLIDIIKELIKREV